MYFSGILFTIDLNCRIPGTTSASRSFVNLVNSVWRTSFASVASAAFFLMNSGCLSRVLWPCSTSFCRSFSFKSARLGNPDVNLRGCSGLWSESPLDWSEPPPQRYWVLFWSASARNLAFTFSIRAFGEVRSWKYSSGSIRRLISSPAAFWARGCTILNLPWPSFPRSSRLPKRVERNDGTNLIASISISCCSSSNLSRGGLLPRSTPLNPGLDPSMPRPILSPLALVHLSLTTFRSRESFRWPRPSKPR